MTTRPSHSSLLWTLGVWASHALLVSGWTTLHKPLPRSFVQSSRLHFAVIYGGLPDSEDDYTPSSYNDTLPASSGSPTALFDAVSHEVDGPALWARLSVAFGPGLDKINQVSLLGVDDSHVELEAVVCDDSSCVTVHIPVDFPHSCVEAANQVECVMDNLHELDRMAQETCQRRENEQNYAEDYDYIRREYLELQQVDDIEYPKWWVPPAWNDAEYQAECKSLRSLLNEASFQNDLLDVCNKVLSLTDGTSARPFEAMQVAVGAIGPSGMIFRANIASQGPSEGDPSSALLSSTDMYRRDIALSFGVIVYDVDTLRDAVLRYFE
jgi:hypothetical protein